jgi:hypothetical protein
MKIHPVGTEFFYADERTDRYTMLIVAFCSFANAIKIGHGSFLVTVFCLKISI